MDIQVALIPTFLALLLAHLVGDFVFQSDKTVTAKATGAMGAQLRHALAHYLLALASLALFAPEPLGAARGQAMVLGLAAAHLVIDLGKARLVAWVKNPAMVLFLDQLLHLAAIAVCALAIDGEPLKVTGAVIEALRANSVPILAVLAVYLGLVFGCGYLIGALLQPLRRKLRTNSEELTEELEKAGRYIGWLERFLLITAIVTGSFAAVGLIVAAKSLFRFPELKDRPFAEYFLIGTLLSVAAATLGGLLLAAFL